MKTTAGIAKKAMSREFEAAVENYNKLGKIIIFRGALLLYITLSAALLQAFFLKSAEFCKFVQFNGKMKKYTLIFIKFVKKA